MSERRDEMMREAYEQLQEAWALFVRKSAGYKDQVFDFDVRAQALEVNRKNGKVKSMLWDGDTSEFETVEEVLQDLIGHCLITLARLKLEGNPHHQAPTVEEIREGTSLGPCPGEAISRALATEEFRVDRNEDDTDG